MAARDNPAETPGYSMIAAGEDWSSCSTAVLLSAAHTACCHSLVRTRVLPQQRVLLISTQHCKQLFQFSHVVVMISIIGFDGNY
jgi:hypothetical protein